MADVSMTFWKCVVINSEDIPVSTVFCLEFLDTFVVKTSLCLAA